MADSRLLVYPDKPIDSKEVTIVHSDGLETTAIIEETHFDVGFASERYTIALATTEGKKGLPNQDFAGVAVLEMNVAGEVRQCIFSFVSDGVSTRPKSEEMAESMVKTAIGRLVEANHSGKHFFSLDMLTDYVWESLIEGVRNAPSGDGYSTLTASVLMDEGGLVSMRILNCGDSRAYWGTTKEVRSSAVHTDVFTGRMTRCMSTPNLGSKWTEKDIYDLDSMPRVSLFLCTDGLARIIDGAYFPRDLVELLHIGTKVVKDHLTAINIYPND